MTEYPVHLSLTFGFVHGGSPLTLSYNILYMYNFHSDSMITPLRNYRTYMIHVQVQVADHLRQRTDNILFIVYIFSDKFLFILSKHYFRDESCAIYDLGSKQFYLKVKN